MSATGVIDDAARDYRTALSLLGETLGHGWNVTDWVDRPLRWRFFEPAGSRSPAHGWKIHVSASAAESARMLRDLASVLARLRLPFKLLRHIEDVVFLNSGDAGAEQLGKVLTVYPPDADDARAAMIAIDAAWPLGHGPEVITDRQLRSGSAVSFRHGVYRVTDEVVDSAGVHRFAWRRADGTLCADAPRAVVDADADADAASPHRPCPAWRRPRRASR